MRNLTEANVTDAVLAAHAGCSEARLKQVLESLVLHLHAFLREVEPTPEEWLAGIRFLTETGHMCDENRQEFILLSDTLGATILIDAINNRRVPGATESSVLGPFYMDGAPERPPGTDLGGSDGPHVRVAGRVRDVGGKPLAGALLDVWQSSATGLYHMQDEAAPPYDLCGRLRTDTEGRFSFTTRRPASYSIPTDGPVGRLLRRVGRHPYRPAHIHFIVSAANYTPVVTELFTEGDQYLDSDAVFGVKASLIVPLKEDGTEADGTPCYRLEYDFVLEPERAPAPRRTPSSVGPLEPAIHLRPSAPARLEKDNAG